MRASTALVLLGFAGAIGLSIFGALAWRAVTIDTADSGRALAEFSAVRDSLGSTEPLLRVGPSGRVERETPPFARDRHRLTRLNVLAYQAGDGRLVRAHVPFWFFKLKGPAVQLALRGTNVDLKRLGVTPADLEELGPGLVLDETGAQGDRILIWTE